MTKRKYGYWGTIGSASYAGGDTGVPGWITAAYEGSRANDITYLYANERHNILNVQFNGANTLSADSTDYVVTPPCIAGEVDEDLYDVYAFYKAPINTRVAYPGNLRVWFLCKSSSESVTAGIRVAAVAPYAASVSTVIHSSTTAWYSLDLTLPEVYPPQTYPVDYQNLGGTNLCLFASIGPGLANQLTVYSVCAYQRQTASTPVHVQLDAATNSIGDNDKPMSQAIAKLLQDETNCQYTQRMPRSNVSAHWFPRYYAATISASYPANISALGEYKLVKRAGCSAIYTYYCVNNSTAVSSEWTLKTTIASTVEGSQEIADIRYNAVHYWVGSKFTFTTANTTAEKELTLKICHKLSNTSGAVANVFGVCVTEKPPSTTSLSHTIPDASQYAMGEYLLASQVEDERATLTHLWKRQPAIALSDWRQTVLSNSNLVKCTTTTYSKTHPPLATGGSQTSLVARALAWPSYGCSRIRVTMGFQTYLSANAPEESSSTKKAVMFQLSDSTVNATAVWTGPMTYTDTSNNVQQSYYEGYFNINNWQADGGAGFRGDKWVDYFIQPWRSCYAHQMNLRANTTVVSSARWLSPTSTISAPSVLNPLQVWVFAWTASTADYIMPTYVSIEEVPLTEGEFP